MRVGVTGTTGFIGSHLLNALQALPGIHVFPLIRTQKNSPPAQKELKDFVADKEVIYHLAGVNRGTEEEILNGNILGTLHLLLALKTTGSPKTRIIFSSSSQVYQHGKENALIRESRATQPESLYGVSKKTAEDLIRLSGSDHIILRLSNVYGPGCRPNYNSVIATFCDRTVKGQPLIIDGNGRQGRDFIFIDDVIQAMVLAGTGKQSKKRAVYNISSGRVSSLRQVIGNIKRAGENVNVEYKKAEDGYSYGCDSSRFQKNYGWRPATSLAAGIKTTLRDFREGQKS